MIELIVKYWKEIFDRTHFYKVLLILSSIIHLYITCVFNYLKVSFKNCSNLHEIAN